MENIMETKETVRLIRTMSGEYLLGMSDCGCGLDNDTKRKYNQVRKLSIGMTMSGEAQVALIPICPFSLRKLDSITIDSSQIMFELAEDDIQSELVNSYKSEISGIAIAKSVPDIIV